jgi:murein DD-endopeptidase MepM/ murein hydrolase activator NlpD
VILRHDQNTTSLYAHNEKNFASPGDVVEKGDVIAESGETGNATGPHVHFEIRRARKPDNPILYLP